MRGASRMPSSAGTAARRTGGRTSSGPWYSVAGGKDALLCAVRASEGRTFAVVRFSRTFRRSLSILRSDQAMVGRCFTVVFEGTAAAQAEAEVIAHDADEGCSAVAR
ncbi:hypothetical protein [Streptomyces bicolor]|uniref:hypothetical protein n=1 Tax=Streptomyces bicolor TaxID=66874 RepID=UPI0004E17C33|nr:hypothetical protein [Streptomyces bicolor]